MNNIYWFAFIPIAILAPFVSAYFTWRYYDSLHYRDIKNKFESAYDDIVLIDNVWD